MKFLSTVISHIEVKCCAGRHLSCQSGFCYECAVKTIRQILTQCIAYFWTIFGGIFIKIVLLSYVQCCTPNELWPNPGLSNDTNYNNVELFYLTRPNMISRVHTVVRRWLFYLWSVRALFSIFECCPWVLSLSDYPTSATNWKLQPILARHLFSDKYNLALSIMTPNDSNRSI